MLANASFALKALVFAVQICTHIWGTMNDALRPLFWDMRWLVLLKVVHITVRELR
jgi:hypothetical protein